MPETSFNYGGYEKEYKRLINENMMVNPNSTLANQYVSDMYNSIDNYENTVMGQIQGSELEAYRMLGQQQLQLENQIAEQRMNSLKSGVTSAQLASQELANIFAAQTGAAQIANQVLSNRIDLTNNFAQQRASVVPSMYQSILANQQAYGSILGQMNASNASYASYVNTPYAEYNAARMYSDVVDKLTAK